MLVCSKAVWASVDRRDGEGPQLEVRVVDTRIGDDVHPQPGAQVVVLAAKECAGAVEHIVHAHNRGST